MKSPRIAARHALCASLSALSFSAVFTEPSAAVLLLTYQIAQILLQRNDLFSNSTTAILKAESNDAAGACVILRPLTMLHECDAADAGDARSLGDFARAGDGAGFVAEGVSAV